MSEGPASTTQLRRAYRVALVLGGTTFGLAAAVLFLLLRGQGPDAAGDPLPFAQRLSPEVRAEAVAALVEQSPGIWDSHPDPEVARVLQPGLARQLPGLWMSSNDFGIRGRPYRLPRPERSGLRVVLLGDSYVFGIGLNDDQRVGSFLERSLNQRLLREGAAAPAVEVLQIGLTQWNIVAECAYLRRQLDLLRPDLVIHVLVGNDLDDNPAVRGFGVPADFCVPVADHGSTLIEHVGGVRLGFPRAKGWLLYGKDWESERRYADAAARIVRLSKAVEMQGGRYLALVAYWSGLLSAAKQHLVCDLAPEQVAYLPVSFRNDPRYRLSSEDPHWSPEGSATVARMLHGLIQERELLPARLQPWPEATGTADELHGAGLTEADDADQVERRLRNNPPRSAIDFARLDVEAAGQIHGGLDADGTAGPYVSFVLGNESADRLVLVGEALPRRELDGAQLRIFVDDQEVAALTLHAGAELRVDAPLPIEARERPFLCVRGLCDDYVYQGAGLRDCRSWRLREVRVE